MNYHFIGGCKNDSGARIRLSFFVILEYFNFSILHEIKWALALGSPIVNSDIIFRVETFCGNFINIPPSKWRLVLLAGWRAAVRCWNGSISSASVQCPQCPQCPHLWNKWWPLCPGETREALDTGHWILCVECRVLCTEDTTRGHQCLDTYGAAIRN